MKQRQNNSSRIIQIGLLLVALLSLNTDKTTAQSTLTSASFSYIYTKTTKPVRTVVIDTSGRWLSTFTDGSYTVTLNGPIRTFTGSTASNAVSTSIWVRTLSAPFAGKVDEAWLTSALADRSADVLETAMHYVENAPPTYNTAALKIEGDASYGPLLADGTHQEGSDFNDYLGIPWAYFNFVDQPESSQVNSLDCSGFVRMVFGYRMGLPLTLSPDGSSLPRRAVTMLESAPGVEVIPNSGQQAEDISPLSAGDLVFFDASINDGTAIDHVGIFLGQDTGGNFRFISSRKSINGPTLGDYNGKSILNGTGLYARAFRAARRL
ncbi:MAG: C40 family peptidase [Tatlockia sp.]|nr:C40 family peptidase [Tatlockia sp.]